MSQEETKEAFNWDAFNDQKVDPSRAQTITSDPNVRSPASQTTSDNFQTVSLEDGKTIDIQNKKRTSADMINHEPLVTPDGTYKAATFIQRSKMSALGDGKDYTVYAAKLDLTGNPRDEDVFDAAGTLADIIDKTTAIQLGGGTSDKTRQTGLNAVKRLISTSREKGIEPRDAVLYDSTRGLVTRLKANRYSVSDDIVEVAIKESKEKIFGEKRKKKGDSTRIKREIRELVQLLGVINRHVIAPLAVYNSDGRAAVVIRKCNPVDPKDLTYAQLAQGYMEVAKGVEVLHRLGMIHRDIKPDNMFLEYNPEDPEEIWGSIADASIAKVTSREAKQVHTLTEEAGAIIGTPQFMAPEQVHGIATYQTDVAGLGAALYYDVTGEFVNPGNSIEEMVINRYNNKYRPQDPRKIVQNPEDAQRLEWLTQIMAACLIGDKDHMNEDGRIAQRYKNVTEVVEDLRLVYMGRAPQHVQRIVQDNTSFDSVEDYVSAVFSEQRPECLPKKALQANVNIDFDPSILKKKPSKAKIALYTAVAAIGIGAAAAYALNEFLAEPDNAPAYEQQAPSGE